MKASLNRIFRIIWSETLGSWVAVSEITKARGKRSVSGFVRAPGSGDPHAEISSSRRVRLKPILLALAGIFSFNVLANPVGSAVVNGQASFNTSGNTLVITNTPGTIINWQGFSIGANETTIFAQQNAASTVLNRVVTNSPSSILGALQSNGRVFLVNPNGIVFGKGATVDVAGLVATTLNLSDADFLAGRNNFAQVPGAQNISNAGNLNAQNGGEIYLIAPSVENSGIITAPNGEILLVAGNSVELVNSNDPNLRVSITAPAGNATNLGKLIVESGSLGLFGSMVRNSGTASADSAIMQGGRIVFKASQNTEVDGAVSATGATGGNIEILGNQVALVGSANVDASGVNGGGTVLIGGDAHGANPNVQNAQFTYVDAAATIKADAVQNGNGGKIVVWSDNATQFSGNISARGGALSGNGGWVETSGKQWLGFSGLVDTRATNGLVGSLLLDPTDITISTAADSSLTWNGTSYSGTLATGNLNVITLQTQLGLTNVTVDTNSTAPNPGNITVANAFSWNSANSLTLNAVGTGSITTNAGATITNTGTGGLTITTAGGGIALNGDISLAGLLTTSSTAGTTLSGTNSLGALTNSGGLLSVTGGATTVTGAFSSPSVNVSAGTLNLNSGGTGAISIGAAGTLNTFGALGGPLVNNGNATFAVSAGAYTGAYSGPGALTLNVNGGAFSFAPTFVGGYVFPSITYINLGNLNFDVNATISNLNLQGSSFRGAGAITIAPGGTLTVAGTTLGGLSALNVSAGATANFSNAAIYRPVTNLGTMNVTGMSTISTVPSACCGSNNGSLTNGATGVLNLNSGYLQPRNGGTFTNNVGGQVIALSGYNTIDATGSTFTSPLVGTIFNNGSITINNLATLAITNGFASTNSGTYTTAVGGTMTFNKAGGAPVGAIYTYTNANALTNNGTASVNGTNIGNTTNTGALTLSTAIVNGALTNSGTGTVTTAGANTVSGAITNASTAVNGFTVVTGTTLAAASFMNTGTLAGGGTLNLGAGTLTNNGIIAPGGTGSIGTLTITGNLVMGLGSSIALDLNGPTAGSYDVLNISGTTNLTSGTLSLFGTGGVGSYPVIVSTAGLGGTTFGAINPGSFLLTPTYAATSVTLMVNGIAVALASAPAPVTLTPIVTSVLANITANIPTNLEMNTPPDHPLVLVAAGGNITTGSVGIVESAVSYGDIPTNPDEALQLAQPMVGCQ